MKKLIIIALVMIVIGCCSGCGKPVNQEYKISKTEDKFESITYSRDKYNICYATIVYSNYLNITSVPCDKVTELQ